MGKITDKTLIPVGLAVVVIGGAAGWCTKVTFELSALAANQQEKKAFEQKVDDRLLAIEKEVSKLNGQLQTFLKRRNP